jgi:hypothetical protein
LGALCYFLLPAPALLLNRSMQPERQAA